MAQIGGSVRRENPPLVARRPNAALVRAIEENEAEFLLALGRAGGGEERDEPGATPGAGGESGRIHWIIGGSPVAYHNCVVHADLAPEQADREIAASVERFRACGVPGSWHVGPSMRPLDLRERLRAQGFTGCGPGGEPGMAADLTMLPADVPAPSGLAIERVRDIGQLESFRQVLAAGFGEGEPEANWICATYAKFGLDDDTAWRHFLGWLGGVPVSTASVFYAVGVAGVYFVCTAPDYRRRGIGAATTLVALRAARDEGFQTAILGASAMGYRIYERLGFREYCRIGVPEYEPARADPPAVNPASRGG